MRVTGIKTRFINVIMYLVDRIDVHNPISTVVAGIQVPHEQSFVRVPIVAHQRKQNNFADALIAVEVEFVERPRKPIISATCFFGTTTMCSMFFVAERCILVISWAEPVVAVTSTATAAATTIAATLTATTTTATLVIHATRSDRRRRSA